MPHAPCPGGRGRLDGMVTQDAAVHMYIVEYTYNTYSLPYSSDYLHVYILYSADIHAVYVGLGLVCIVEEVGTKYSIRSTKFGIYCRYLHADWCTYLAELKTLF